MSIVNINVSITNPPKPSVLLKSGAFVSVGGTNLPAGTLQLLATKTDLAAYLEAANAISSIVWASGTVTVTLANPHGVTVGQTEEVFITGNVPAGYNGNFTATATTATALTYPLATNPGTSTSTGTLTSGSDEEIQQMNDNFWAQGSTRAVYVLELGDLDTADAVAALKTYIANDTALGRTYQSVMSYLVPREFDESAEFKALTSLYTAPDAIVYFWIPTTSTTWQAWNALGNKSTFYFVPSPDAPDDTFDLAAAFQSSLSNDPGSSNLVPPMSYRFTYGTTAYPVTGNSSVMKAMDTGNANYITDAAEGGLSNMMLVKGHMGDGNPFNYWYSVAWAIINLELDLANEVINGSNTTTNPLYYDQPGIDRLQKRALKTVRAGISYGLLLGTGLGPKLTQINFTNAYNNGDYNGEAVVNAVPFTSYTTLNESAYQEGEYGGLSAIVTPRRGFESITFNLNVTNFVG